MKRIIALLVFCGAASIAVAQTCADFAVQLSVTTQISPARITLNWKRLGDTTTYYVFKKAKNSFSWGSAIATLTTRDSSYADASVIVDSVYEYTVQAAYRRGTTSYTSAGYILAGIKAPALHNRGGLVLMVDSTFSDTCSVAIRKLMKDLSGDGWQVYRHDVPRTLADTGVRKLIAADYTNNSNVKAVLLLGHVAVPYSGDINPDAHTDHKGAWPADLYYAYISAPWTDASVNNSTSSNPLNRNVPRDGKWDQIGWTIRSELQVGRVDFWNMPAFGRSEAQLMNSYLAKDHSFKMDSIAVRKRAVIDDNFGVFALGGGMYEAFASSAWRSFPPMVGKDSIIAGDFIGSLDSGSFLWAYGCGGGSYQSASGIGSTSDFASKNLKGIFTMLFGSYFGDWNVQDNFLRAPLCAPTPALTCAWSGRPYWFFHQMALGENIGYCTWQTQNNDGNLYGPFSYGYQWVHVGLMGDVSLRTEYIKPVSNVRIALISGRGATVTWNPSPDGSVAGYYVYRSDNGEFGNYKLISGLVTGTSYRDTVGRTGLKYYMVRPSKLQNTPSGAYNNLGIGVSDSASVLFVNAIAELAANYDWTVYPNPTQGNIGLSVDALQAAEMNVEIVSIIGERLISTTKQLQSGNNRFTFDLSLLASGNYLVKTSVGTTSSTRMVVKL
jgi:hypothetical protein